MRVTILPFVLVSLIVSEGVAVPLSANTLTPAAQRGLQIYVEGTSPTGYGMTAVLGKEGVEVPASVLPCVNCHGHDGRGRPEGGVTPSNITWEALTKPYGVTHSGGRTHPPYTEDKLKRAIMMGIDAVGQQLHVAMPRYRLSPRDLTDLVAYLKQIGTQLAPGLTETTIRVGTILPPSKTPAGKGQAIRGVLTAYFDAINRQGGIYNRRIEVHFAESPERPVARAEAARAFLEDAQVFALASSFMSGADADIASLAREHSVPMIGAFTRFPQVDFPLNRHVFYLYGGLKEQGRALAMFAAKEYAATPLSVAIVHLNEKTAREVADVIQTQAQASGWPSGERIEVFSEQFSPSRLVGALRDKEIGIVFFLGSSSATSAFFQEAHAHEWTPIVLMPGTWAGQEIFDAPKSFDGRIFLSYPTLPVDRTPGGMREYLSLAEPEKRSSRHLTAQLFALSSAKVLLEGIRRAGRDISREKLIEELEGLYEFHTGLTPAVSFGPNRRIGALGAYIVSIDLQAKTLVPLNVWIELN